MLRYYKFHKKKGKHSKWNNLDTMYVCWTCNYHEVHFADIIKLYTCRHYNYSLYWYSLTINYWNMLLLNIAESGSSNGEHIEMKEVKVYVCSHKIKRAWPQSVAQIYVLVNTYCNWYVMQAYQVLAYEEWKVVWRNIKLQWIGWFDTLSNLA